MRAKRTLFLLTLALCGYWLWAPPATALPLQGIAQSLAGPVLTAARAKAKKRVRKKTASPASGNAGRGIAPSAATVPVPLPAQPPPAPNVKLKAALAASGPALSEGVGWRVTAERPEPAAEKIAVWSGGGGEASFHLTPGRYFVEATFGLASHVQEIQIAPDAPLESTVVLNAGTILARAVASPGGQPLDNMFYVLRRADAAGLALAEVGRSSQPRATFHVAAGAYRLAMQHGLARAEIPVTVAAGEQAQAEGVMNSGHLKLSATASEGGPVLEDAVFFIYADNEGLPPREVARSELARPEFDLAAGQYRIAAQWGAARVEQPLTVKAGASLSETIVLDAGTVKLTAVLAGSDKPIDRQLIYKVYAMSGEQGTTTQAAATSARPTPVLYLKSGKYRIESQYGWHNARQTREVDVNAGQTTDLLFEHKACEVKLTLAIAPNTPAPGRVKWTVKYANGGTVLISQDDAPLLVLQAGSYQAVAQYGNKTYSRAFEANPNEVNVIELFAE